MVSKKDILRDAQNDAILLSYINFVGEKEVLSLSLRFNVNKFVGRWQQVLTSLSTSILGTNLLYSTVTADYSLNSDGTIKVKNSAYDENFEITTIDGISRARSPLVPTCRTVEFNEQLFEGNYWIIYISADFNTIIVSAPIIIGPIDLTSNFGLYVLTRNRETYWNSNEPQKVFDTLEKYGFNQLWNFPINSGASFPMPNPVPPKVEKKINNKKNKK